MTEFGGSYYREQDCWKGDPKFLGVWEQDEELQVWAHAKLS